MRFRLPRFSDLFAIALGFTLTAAATPLLAQTATHIAPTDVSSKCLTWDIHGTDPASILTRVFKLYDKTGGAPAPGVVTLPKGVSGTADPFTVQFTLPSVTQGVDHCYAFTSTDGNSPESAPSDTVCYVIDPPIRPQPAPGFNGRIAGIVAGLIAAFAAWAWLAHR